MYFVIEKDRNTNSTKNPRNQSENYVEDSNIEYKLVLVIVSIDAGGCQKRKSNK